MGKEKLTVKKRNRMKGNILHSQMKAPYNAPNKRDDWSKAEEGRCRPKPESQADRARQATSDDDPGGYRFQLSHL